MAADVTDSHQAEVRQVPGSGVLRQSITAGRALGMKVSGIDPAPTKGLSVFDGQDREIELGSSAAFVADHASSDDQLICWDAPLTGPPSSVVGGAAAAGAAFSQRPIESFFSRGSTGFKTPKGISVQGYSGCPHWALTRCMLGLPRVGTFDAAADSLPFLLLTREEQRPARGRCVVEVHPAVALWLWCREGRSAGASWQYKKDEAVLLELWEELLEVPAVAGVLSHVRAMMPKSDDELDARVAYALGRLWLDAPDAVMLLGDADSGSFLVPRVKGLEMAFQAFIEGS
jgi:hypothetical protein